MERIGTFDLYEYLDTPEVIAEYLSQVAEEGDEKEFLETVGGILKARGIGRMAEETGLDGGSLREAFAPDGNPGFSTVWKVLNALGVSVCFRATGDAAAQTAPSV